MPIQVRAQVHLVACNSNAVKNVGFLSHGVMYEVDESMELMGLMELGALPATTTLIRLQIP